MHQWIQIFLLYLVGLMQGINLVTYPAAGALLTNPHYQNLSASEYGSLFIPMIIAAICASLGGGRIAMRWGLRSVFLFGLVANIITMLLFALTALFSIHALNIIILMFALFFLGLGFGSTLTVLNTYVEKFFPNKTAVAMTCLHTLLGLGTAIAPLLFDAFHTFNVWWGDPLFLSGTFVVLFLLSVFFIHDAEKVESKASEGSYSLNFWIYVVILFFYGFCETTFGNWATIYLHTEKGLSTTNASYALSVFWGMVTVGRIITALLSTVMKPARIYIVLPVLIVIAFIVIPFATGPWGNIALFGFGGLACSGCFPLTFSLAENDFPSIASVIAGWLMASYMLGYGFAAYGIGMLNEYGNFSLNWIYLFAAIPAAIMALLVIWILRRRILS